MKKPLTGTILLVTFCIVLMIISITLVMSSPVHPVPDAAPTVTASLPAMDLEVPDQPQSPEPAKAMHILLAGIDGKSLEYGRTDSIILATLSPAGNTVKLTSFMRDLYLEIPGHSYNKINAAYAFGGMDLLISTLRQNFGLTVQKYIAINFDGFEDVVDLLGGVDIDVKDYEISRINRVKLPGLQHLDGRQALQYCRIRYAGNSDYERTERQRRVLTILAQKARQMPLSSYHKLYTNLRPLVDTNLSLVEILKLGYAAYTMEGFTIDTLRIPADDAHVATYVDQMAVLIPDIPVNRARLERFLYPSPVESIPERPGPRDETALPYPLADSPTLRRQASCQAEPARYGVVSPHLTEASN